MGNETIEFECNLICMMISGNDGTQKKSKARKSNTFADARK